MKDAHVDIFGQVQMGYIVIESRKLDEWRRFGEEGLGLHLASAEAGTVAFRMDAHQRRIIVRNGPAEDVAALGFQLASDSTLQIVKDRLQRRGVDVSRGDDEAAALRGVTAFWQLRGPRGLAIELFVDPLTSSAPLSMLSSGFNTGECGMGHVAIVSRQPEKMLAFWQQIFDARLSDSIEQPMSGLMLDISFLRLNPRHHSVAVAATRGVRVNPVRTQVQHFNIEAASLDDLAAAFRRCNALGYKMAHNIGQHPNDRELSFYVFTPSGFEMEYGWAAVAVDESTWQPTRHRGISLWGHRGDAFSPFSAINELQLGLRSLLRREFSPF